MDDTENGYSCQPTFEYIETIEGRRAGASDLMTEGYDNLQTEAGQTIMVEGA